MRATPAQSECPRCHRPSTRVHSYYTRSVADLPWHGVAVRLALHARRFRCQNSLCTKRIFCERLPRVVAHYARQTVRMNEVLQLIGFLLGGEAGARAAVKFAMKASPDTLLRRVRAAVKPCAPTPRVLGVDDFAFRRGQRYGTILVDLEKRRVIDLLPDREAATLGTWLKAHPGIEIISRDRSPSYASGINEGAPGAVQVADRFHLLLNVREALEKVMMRHNRFLRSQTLAAPVSTATTEENDAYAGCRLRLQPHLARPKRVRRRRASPRLRLPSAREATWMLLRPDELKDEEKQIVELLCSLSPEVGRAQGLALRFIELIKERRVDELRRWLIDAQRSDVPEFVSFANELTDDLRAVKAALEYEWSQGQVEGQVEGQVHGLKLIKRQMYGRGKLDLLRARVLRAA
ncbi:MAG: ISL3 family transposase [Acidobacteria bacterium]|nr:ISL3 family transposase [Acidobacteriota bacterium]